MRPFFLRRPWLVSDYPDTQAASFSSSLKSVSTTDLGGGTMQFRQAVIGLAIMSAFTFCGPARPATAADCADGHLCMWEDPGYSGSQYVDQPGNPGRYDIDWWNGDNEISSVINKTGKCIKLY